MKSAHNLHNSQAHNLYKIMEIKIQLADSVYKKLVSGNARVRGTIGLVSPTEGNFNAHRPYQPKPGTKYVKLPHGRVSVGQENVRMQDTCLQDLPDG